MHKINENLFGFNSFGDALEFKKMDRVGQISMTFFDTKMSEVKPSEFNTRSATREVSAKLVIKT